MDGKVVIARAEDETVGFKLQEAEMESLCGTDGIDGWDLCAVDGQGVVMPIDDRDVVLAQEGVHCCGLLGVYADCDKALPGRAAGDRIGPREVKDGVGDFNALEDICRLDSGTGDGCRMRDDGNGLGEGDGMAGGSDGRESVCREQIEDGQILRLEHAIEAIEAEEPLSIKEVRDMRLLKAGGAGEGRTGESSAVDAADDFEAQVFVKGGKPHAKTISLGYS